MLMKSVSKVPFYEWPREVWEVHPYLNNDRFFEYEGSYITVFVGCSILSVRECVIGNVIVN